jgi:hypothetical protein
MWKIALFCVAIFHFWVVILMVGAFCWIPFLADWYIWIPINVYICRLAFDTNSKACPVTVLENYIRRKVGMATVRGGFIQNYMIRPIKAYFIQKRK